MVQAVRGVRAGGLKTGLVSNSWSVDHYDRDLLAELFDEVVISAEVRMHKPEPEIYLLAAERLGVRPERLPVRRRPARELRGRRGGRDDRDPPRRPRGDDRPAGELTGMASSSPRAWPATGLLPPRRPPTVSLTPLTASPTAPPTPPTPEPEPPPPPRTPPPRPPPPVGRPRSPPPVPVPDPPPPLPPPPVVGLVVLPPAVGSAPPPLPAPPPGVGGRPRGGRRRGGRRRRVAELAAAGASWEVSGPETTASRPS